MSKHIYTMLIGVVIIFAGIFLIIKKSANNVAVTPNEQTQVITDSNSPDYQPDDANDRKMAFKYLLAQNGTYECTATYTTQGIESQGTVWMDAGKQRGDFNTTVAGKNITGSFLVRDGSTYTWSSLSTKGYQAKHVTTDGANTGTAAGTYTWDPDGIGEYDCKEWKADQSKFSLPAGITFETAK
jgi:hypothetical protein